MLFTPKTLRLNDPSTAILRSPDTGDEEAILHLFRAVAEQSPFLARYPEEFSETTGDQETRIAETNDSANALMRVLFRESELIAIGTVSRYTDALAERLSSKTTPTPTSI